MADTIARIRKMQVRPSRSADLAFNMPGIIDRQNFDLYTGVGSAHLGSRVTAFDIAGTLYDHLGETLGAVTVPTDPGFPREARARLKYDSATIAGVMTTPPSASDPAPFLFALRNVALAASLDQLVNQRENAFLEKYKHGAKIQQAMQTALPAIVTRLQTMKSLAQDRFDALEAAYNLAEQSGRDPVVTKSVTTNSVSSDYAVTTNSTTKNKSVAIVNGAASLLNGDLTTLNTPVSSSIDSDVYDDTANPPNKVQTQKSPGTVSLSYARTGDNKSWEFPPEEYISQTAKDTTTTVGMQQATTPNQSFLHPRFDNKVSHEQLQASLLGEEMNQVIASLKADYMEKILSNELASLDQEARKLQTNFAHTYLTSPISGVVTIVYKDLGESVQAGEPVLRVENDDLVYAVGHVLYRGLLRIGQQVTIRITDLFADETPLDFPGMIKAIRGHDSDNDEWEIAIECVNPVVSGVKALPLYYQFDHDLSEIVVH